MVLVVRLLLFILGAGGAALMALPFLREVVLPADLRRTLETGEFAAFFGGDPLRTFGTAGLLLTVAVVVLVSSGIRDEGPSRGPNKGPVLKPGQKPTRKLARALLEARRYPEAADMFRALGDVPGLIEALTGAGKWPEAADLLESEGRHREAADLLDRSKDAAVLERAMELWKALNLPDKAAEAMRRAAGAHASRGEGERAVELLLRHQDTKTAEQFLMPAAEALARKEQHARAAELFERFGRHAQAGAAFEYAASHIHQEAARRSTFARAAVAYKNAGDMASCGRVLEAAGYPDKAIEAYQRAERWEDAARMMTAAGQSEAAARLLIEKGMGQKAVAYFEAQGDFAAAGHAALASGDMVKAAQLFEEGGNLDAAFKAHVQGGNHNAAADIALQRNRPVEAAELLEKGGNHKRAAEIQEQMGNRLKAGELYAKAGNDAAAARMLLAEGRIREAASILAGQGKPEVADVQMELARKMVMAGDLRGAVTFLRGAVDARPAADSLVMALELSNLLEAAGEIPVALAYAQRAAQAKPDHAEAVMRVQQLFMRVNSDQMKAAYEAAMKQQMAAQASLSAQRRMVESKAPTAQEPPRYVSEGELGRGAMGVVYRARDTVLNRMVALKRLPEAVASDPEARGRFLEEARAAARLNHPCVVTVFDAGVEGGSPYLAMELVEGTTLASLLGQNIPPARALQWCGAIAAALDHAHKAGIVHRDVKPGNILMGKDGRVKLTDFGIAALLSKGGEGVTGTPYYMSPEQVLGQAVDGRADIYALGCVLFALLRGEPPFIGQDVLQRHLHDMPPALSQLRPGVPPEVDAMIARMMAKNPAQRFQTAAECATALLALDQRLRAAGGAPA